MSYRVVITDCQLPDSGIERAMLAEIGAEVLRAACKTPQEVVAVAEDADALMVQRAPITSDVIRRLRRCRIISAYAVGLDTIDVEAANARGIRVVANTDYCIDEVAQHALALLLACSRKLAPAISAIKAANWNKRAIMEPLTPLGEQTLGLVGFGRIGRRLAQWASSLVKRILVYDPFLEANAGVPAEVSLTDLDVLLRESDYISIHCPLSASTRKMFNSAAFHKMKRTAHLINTSRGPIVDEEALVAALREGVIDGAALDVFQTEPLPAQHPLLLLPNVLATPHVAWYSDRALRLLQENTARAVVEHLRALH